MLGTSFESLRAKAMPPIGPLRSASIKVKLKLLATIFWRASKALAAVRT